MGHTRSGLLGRASLAAAGLLGLGWASVADAAVIGSADDDFTVSWSLAAGAPDNDGGVTSPIPLTATASFDVQSITSNAVTLLVTVTNTTVLGSGVSNAGITSLGIGVAPDATGVSFSDADSTGFVNAVLDNNGNFPGGFKSIDLCVFTDNNCSGSGQGSALAVGASDTFTLTISGNFGATPSVTLDPFPIKFQTSAGSFEFAGSDSSTSVPEPTALALLGTALLGLGVARRARRKA